LEFNIIDPLADERWGDFAAKHPKASVFHQPGWLEALARTYGYDVFALTSTATGSALTDGVVFCRVSSWITGTRAVSLSFSDHCEPLMSADQIPELCRYLAERCGRQGWKYVELRPREWNGEGQSQFRGDHAFCFHTLDLTQSVEHLFQGFHRDSIQRKIQRAERERVSYEPGSSEHLVDEFYGLLVMTRKRHRLVPQPRAWFRNLVTFLGAKLQIRIARKDGVAIAAILSLRHGSSVVYKYGCSNEEFHSLGAVPFLFWKLIEESKSSGTEELDFGRSDLDQKGLITFKDRFGTRMESLNYFRYSRVQRATAGFGPARWLMDRFVPLVPDTLLPAAGRVLYRHMG
jgi:CelD/BcsL family acetyltransferase involved in cellulose biosynthesis